MCPTFIEVRGFAVKFYTKEGNWDLVETIFQCSSDSSTAYSLKGLRQFEVPMGTETLGVHYPFRDSFVIEVLDLLKQDVIFKE